MSKIASLKTMGWIGLAAAALVLCACAGPWQKAPSRLHTKQWSITPPEGWMHLEMPDSDMLSKDGPYLQYILAQERPLDRGFRFTRQKLNPGMLPHEAARLITDNLRADTHIRRFRLRSIEPATIGGYSGFKLSYTHQDQLGVDIDTVYYGVIVQDRFFNLRYSAAKRHYFDSQLAAFDRVLQSIVFISDNQMIAVQKQTN